MKYLVFGFADLATGVPQALKAAGLADQVRIVSRAPQPTNLENIKAGTEFASVGEENAAAGYRAVDMLARKLAGGKPLDNNPVGWHQIFTKKNVRRDRQGSRPGRSSGRLPQGLGCRRLMSNADTSSGAETYLQISGLSKVFAGQRALSDVDLELRVGEIHALLGQNGSGKSTLIKVLAGVHDCEPGAAARLLGEPYDLSTARHAHDAGFRFIHQDLALAGSLDVVDNLALGTTAAGYHWWSHRRERRRSRELLARFGLDVDVLRPVRTLTAAEQSMIAIIRAVHDTPGGSGALGARRADSGAAHARDRGTVRFVARPAQPRTDDPLRHAPSGGGVRAFRQGHRSARRPPGGQPGDSRA